MDAWLDKFGLRTAALGGLLAVAGDGGQLWCANAGRAELGLRAPPSFVLVAATLIGVLGLSSYAPGYAALGARASVEGAGALGRALRASGIAFAALAAVVHGVTGLLLATPALRSGVDPLRAVLGAHPLYVALWGAATIAFVASNALLLRQLGRRWLALASPLPSTLLIAAAAGALPELVRDFVRPASVNLAHLVFFAIAARAARRAGA